MTQRSIICNIASAVLAVVISACGGGGGSATPNTPIAPAVQPITVKKTSYENKISAAFVTGSSPLPKEVSKGHAAAFADFFQTGEYSLVTHSADYDYKDRSTINVLGQIRFYKMQDGQWVEKTSDLLSDPVGCLSPRKAIVADFNQDGKPDVFFACTGFDGDPFLGEKPLLLLSQGNGKYRKVIIPVTGFFHGASAADVNGDGYPDIVVTDFIAFNRPFFLINNKNETFTIDTSRLPNSVIGQQIFSAELIDFNGKGNIDLFLGGSEQSGTWPATILRNDGRGIFSNIPSTILPALSGYGYPLDIVFTGGNIYLNRTTDAVENYYAGNAIQRIEYATFRSSVIFSRGKINYKPGVAWIDWIIPYGGNIVSMDSVYGLSVPQ